MNRKQKRKVPLHEYNQLKLSGLLVPRGDVMAKVSHEYHIVNPDYPKEYIIAVCSQNMPIAFTLKAVVEEVEPKEYIELSNTLQNQPKALI